MIESIAVLVAVVLSSWCSGMVYGMYRYERTHENRTLGELVNND
jgi:hypothetical protein